MQEHWSKKPWLHLRLRLLTFMIFSLYATCYVSVSHPPFPPPSKISQINQETHQLFYRAERIIRGAVIARGLQEELWFSRIIKFWSWRLWGRVFSISCRPRTVMVVLCHILIGVCGPTHGCKMFFRWNGFLWRKVANDKGPRRFD